MSEDRWVCGGVYEVSAFAVPHQHTTPSTRYTAYTEMSTTSLPSKMRAVGISKTGGLDVIEDLELPVPKPQPSEILVKACRLSPTTAVELGLTIIDEGGICRRELAGHCSSQGCLPYAHPASAAAAGV